MLSDVCLILEGTYPYVAGGVSTWVAQILEAMPHLHFSILYIGPTRDAPRRLKYKIPPNVVAIHEVFVHDYPTERPRLHDDRKLLPWDWERISRFLRQLSRAEPCDLRDMAMIMNKFEDAAEMIQSVAYSRQSWEMTVRHYREDAPQDLGFLDYFWTQRFIGLPVLSLLRAPLPRARVYHSASTGYAGFLGAKATIERGAPLLVTEHGLYTRERRLEIFNANWIREAASQSLSIDAMHSQYFFKEWWTRFFLSLSRTAYRASSRLFTLFEANRVAQVEDGAPADCLQVIPNGIDLEQYSFPEPPPRNPGEPLRIGFVGRVTAIKDVKTLLRALAILHRREVPFEALILGPTDEEEEYALECVEMTAGLGLSDHVKFLGRVNVKSYYGKLDVVVLTSVSEGLPFVILEAHCARIPVVSTDVGACRELLLGRDGEDARLGASGIVTHVASPDETARALETLARDPQLQKAMGEAGLRRVQAYYDIREVMRSYQDAYEYFHYFQAGARGAVAAGTGG